MSHSDIGKSAAFLLHYLLIVIPLIMNDDEKIKTTRLKVVKNIFSRNINQI